MDSSIWNISNTEHFSQKTNFTFFFMNMFVDVSQYVYSLAEFLSQYATLSFRSLFLHFATSIYSFVIHMYGWLNKHVRSLIIYGRNNGAGNVKFHILHKPNLTSKHLFCMSFKFKAWYQVFSHLKVSFVRFPTPKMLCGNHFRPLFVGSLNHAFARSLTRSFVPVSIFYEVESHKKNQQPQKKILLA